MGSKKEKKGGKKKKQKKESLKGGAARAAAIGTFLFFAAATYFVGWLAPASASAVQEPQGELQTQAVQVASFCGANQALICFAAASLALTAAVLRSRKFYIALNFVVLVALVASFFVFGFPVDVGDLPQSLRQATSP